jgi:hypothetical protein
LYNASLSFVNVHIVRTGGSNNFSLSYGGSKRGGGFEIACTLFSSEMADFKDLKLCGMLHCHFGNVHFVGTEGSNYFPMSYGGSQGVAGVRISCVHLSV